MATATYPNQLKNKSTGKTLRQKKIEEALTGYLFMLPAFGIFTIFLIIPIGFAVFISFTNWNGITPLGQTAQGASGLVEFTNLTGDPLTLPEGTIVTSLGKTPIEYRTTAIIEVPANGTAQITVAAVDPSLGKETNKAKNLIQIVPDEYEGRLEVTNIERLDNGKDDAFQLVGIQNFTDVLAKESLAQQDFFLAFKNTVYFVLGVVPTQTVLALLLAVIVNQRWLKAKGVFRTAFYFPSITSSVVISIVFMWMFTQGGLINGLIKMFIPNYESVVWLNDPNGILHNLLGIFGVTRTTAGDWAGQRVAGLTLWEWISGPSVTMFTVMILNTWTTIGTMMVIFLAALQNIPSSVYEAAAIDGATSGQTFRKITVPLLAPTTFFVVTLGLIGTFQVFDQIVVISSGGPAKTTLTIAYNVYQYGFRNNDMGIAAATALVLFVIIFAFTMMQRMFIRERQEF